MSRFLAAITSVLVLTFICASAQERDVASELSALEQSEQAEAEYQEVRASWLQGRVPLLDQLSRSEREARALRAEDHTLEEREAMDAKLADAVAALLEYDLKAESKLAEQQARCEKLLNGWSDDAFFDPLLWAETRQRFQNATATVTLRKRGLLLLKEEAKVEQHRAEKLRLSGLYEATQRLATLRELTQGDRTDDKDLVQELEDLEDMVYSFKRAVSDAFSISQTITIGTLGWLEVIGMDPAVDVKISDEGAIRLLGQAATDAIRSTDLVEARLDSVQALEHFKSAKGIRRLWVSFPREAFPGDDSRAASVKKCVEAVAQKSELEELTLWSAPLGSSGREVLTGLKSLRKLVVTTRYLDADIIGFLARIPVSETLVISGGYLFGSIRGDWVGSLAQLGDVPSLHVHARPSEDEVEFYTELSKLANLASLTMPPTNENFAAIKSARSLTHLDLSRQRWELGWREVDFTVLTELKSLNSLVLDHTTITSEQLIKLSGLAQIEALSLKGCQYLDVAALEAFDGFKGLERVELDMCSALPYWTWTLIQHRRPDCVVSPRADLFASYKP